MQFNPLNELMYMTQTLGAGRLPYNPQDQNYRQAEKNFFRGGLTEEEANAYEQEPVTRAELEQRAYQNEATRLAQQADPYMQGGSPMLDYVGNTGMAINQALYGNMLTPQTVNPLMAGLGQQMGGTTATEQRQAQSLSDMFKNGMMQAQGSLAFQEGQQPTSMSEEEAAEFLSRLQQFQPR